MIRNKYCKFSATSSPTQFCFSQGCSPSLFSVFKAGHLFPHKLTCLKQERKQKTPQPLPTSSVARSPPTSSPFTAHTFRIWIVKRERLPNLADQVRRAGRARLPSWSVCWLPCHCRAKHTLRQHFQSVPKRCS